MNECFYELNRRDSFFRLNMDKFNPNWTIAIFFHRLDIFYFTGTQQNGVYVVPKNGKSLFFVKRNFDLARHESPISNIYQLQSYGDILKYIKLENKQVYINKSNTTVSILESFNKYLKSEQIKSLDRAYYFTRAIKSDYEIKLQKQSGEILREALEEYAPTILMEGISECDLGISLFNHMVDRGHELVTRMRNFNAEMFLGTISFSENACYFCTHDGPAGLIGFSKSSPFLGSKERTLRKGDIIVIDMVCNIGGYHTDKTVIYSWGKVDTSLVKYHKKCLDIEKIITEKLKPGMKPSKIYTDVFSELDSDFLKNFMGYKSNQVKFLGHGIGLNVDEFPVIAEGFELPLEGNMTLAIEPKKCIDKDCMVGSENTYIVSENGGISMTGGAKNIIEL
jgi:Xaa-Pro aminopeptidase